MLSFTRLLSLSMSNQIVGAAHNASPLNKKIELYPTFMCTLTVKPNLHRKCEPARYKLLNLTES